MDKLGTIFFAFSKILKQVLSFEFRKMDKVTYAYVIGIEFAASLVLHLASIWLTWKTLRYFLISRKNAISVVGSKVSVFLIVLLIAWLFTSLSYVPKEIYILSVWRPQGWNLLKMV